jgi:hypothetical protein
MPLAQVVEARVVIPVSLKKLPESGNCSLHFAHKPAYGAGALDGDFTNGKLINTDMLAQQNSATFQVSCFQE